MILTILTILITAVCTTAAVAKLFTWWLGRKGVKVADDELYLKTEIGWVNLKSINNEIGRLQK